MPAQRAANKAHGNNPHRSQFDFCEGIFMDFSLSVKSYPAISCRTPYNDFLINSVRYRSIRSAGISIFPAIQAATTRVQPPMI